MWIHNVVLICVACVAVVLTAPRSSESKVASDKQFPHQVALITQSNRCGGALISKDWILTSALCIEGAATLLAILGAHDISDYEPSQVRFDISMENVHFHEDIHLNDIAAVMLPHSVQFTDYIRPVILPRVAYSELTFEGFDATTSGWSYQKSGELRYGSVNIAKQSDCSTYFQDGEIDASIVCVNTMDDTCHGDVGNPLILQETSATLIGLASLGWSTECTVGQPALFTRITSYGRWIHETTGVINNHF